MPRCCGKCATIPEIPRDSNPEVMSLMLVVHREQRVADGFLPRRRVLSPYALAPVHPPVRVITAALHGVCAGQFLAFNCFDVSRASYWRQSRRRSFRPRRPALSRPKDNSRAGLSTWRSARHGVLLRVLWIQEARRSAPLVTVGDQPDGPDRLRQIVAAAEAPCRISDWSLTARREHG